MKTHPGLVALSVGAFGIGVTEFAPMGLLPLIASDLRVSIPAAGLLVSAYAIGVVVFGPLVVLATSGVSRRTLLASLAAVFTFGNLVSALATNYEWLLVARLITSINHGAFFGIGSVVAAELVPPDRRARAVAAMFMGLTIANVIGVPAATLLGEQFGWRAPFFGISVIGAAAVIALLRTLPSSSATSGNSFRRELGVLRRGSVLSALFQTVLGAGAMFTVYTYIAPLLLEEGGTSSSFVAAMLVLFGVGLTLGNWIGGVYADKSAKATLLCAQVALAAVLLLLSSSLTQPFATALLVLLWGAASFALVPPLQLRVMAAAVDAPTLASTMNIGAFNLGNAIGAALGAAAIQMGWPLATVPIVGAAVALIAAVCVLMLDSAVAIPKGGDVAAEV